MHQRIIIIDYGSQLTQLIARRLRDLRIYCEVYTTDSFFKQIKLDHKIKGVILSGSHASAAENDDSVNIPKFIFDLNVPILGICYGMQLLARQLGGKVEASNKREFGKSKIKIINDGGHLLNNISNDFSKELSVWMSHGDRVVQLPAGFFTIASNQACPIAAMADEIRSIYAVQFHPEAHHTVKGDKILENFSRIICNYTDTWNVPNYSEELIDRIKQQVGNEKVLLALSGGVDSTVAAVLIKSAIGKNLICVFVDHGFLRRFESEEIVKFYTKQLNIELIRVDASSLFMKRLARTIDPEKKRKIIGKTFIEVFESEAIKYHDVRWLAQGTIYPDIIESAHKNSDQSTTIKSHHNVGGLPKRLNLKLLEPLKELFKDEVRLLGKLLGLPKHIIYRHPFPGPGLAIRIVGRVNQDDIDRLRLADSIFIEELHNNINLKTGKSWYNSVSQAFSVLLPIKSVGVMGDARTYERVIALRIVQTTDFMTANWVSLPDALLNLISSRITNEVNGVNRVVFDVSNKPPATIEWE